MIEVLKPGLQTTVQDAGRPGHLGQGIPPAGPQDWYSFRAASILVGNTPSPPPLTLGDPGEAGLEALFIGPKLRFATDTVVAVTGAESHPTLNGDPIEEWSSVSVRAGDVLDVGRARRGVRTYVAVAGGIDVPPDLGSRATYLVGARGGHEGRALQAGDQLPLGSAGSQSRTTTQRIPPRLRPDFERAVETLRVVRGPQYELFTDDGVATFFDSEFRLSPQSSRMGFRFTGPPIGLKPKPDYLIRDAGSGPADIVDDVSPLGAIQVPSGEEVIVLGVEVPSAGGYAKIATLISADLGRLGQLRPSQPVRFEAVELAEALAIAEEMLNGLTADSLEEVRP